AKNATTGKATSLTGHETKASKSRPKTAGFSFRYSAVSSRQCWSSAEQFSAVSFCFLFLCLNGQVPLSHCESACFPLWPCSPWFACFFALWSCPHAQYAATGESPRKTASVMPVINRRIKSIYSPGQLDFNLDSD